ncbi:hypothetical protein [Streptomyces sp. NBC_01445]|uniref:hypothetical protein n=1 Tax=Streptomyces sp. NBC_01445 TaxID=2903869 RepID=UPI002DD848D3|nr:hypothetical protein [Streptomyces sp. NBC_01445]WSE10091.1 hypothetical protein OG574_46270 [Streptomyces sp. NBC_01445]
MKLRILSSAKRRMASCVAWRAGAGAGQGRGGHLGDDAAVPVVDGAQDAAVRRGDPVDGLRVGGDAVDQAAAGIGQCSELGDCRAVPGVVRLGCDVEHVEGHGLAELVENGL